MLFRSESIAAIDLLLDRPDIVRINRATVSRDGIGQVRVFAIGAPDSREMTTLCANGTLQGAVARDDNSVEGIGQCEHRFCFWFDGSKDFDGTG